MSSLSTPRQHPNPYPRFFVRTAIAHALNGCAEEAQVYANARWGDNYMKAGVANTEATGLEALSAPRAEFFDLVFERSVLGRLPGLRRVSRHTRTLRPNNSAIGYWVAQSKAIPVSRFDMAGDTVTGDQKVGAILIFSNESLQDPKQEGAIEGDLARAAITALDTAATDPPNSGDAATPQSITNAGEQIVSSGDPHADLAAQALEFKGDWSTAVYVTDPMTAARLALFKDTGGAASFPDAGPRGGLILGVPLLVSRYMPSDTSGGSIALVDGSGIAAVLGDVSISPSRDALLEQDSAPQGAADTPTAASATLMSMFQTENVAMKVIVHAGWKVVRTGSVVTVTGISY